MLGALLGEMATIYTHPFPDDTTLEEVNEDRHWTGDDNRFDDWLLHPDTDDAADAEPFY